MIHIWMDIDEFSGWCSSSPLLYFPWTSFGRDNTMLWLTSSSFCLITTRASVHCSWTHHVTQVHLRAEIISSGRRLTKQNVEYLWNVTHYPRCRFAYLWCSLDVAWSFATFQKVVCYRRTFFLNLILRQSKGKTARTRNIPGKAGNYRAFYIRRKKRYFDNNGLSFELAYVLWTMHYCCILTL